MIGILVGLLISIFSLLTWRYCLLLGSIDKICQQLKEIHETEKNQSTTNEPVSFFRTSSIGTRNQCKLEAKSSRISQILRV